MRNEDSELWAGLKTVSSFDNGENSSLAMGVTPKEPRHFSPSSLLVESLIDQLCKLMENDPNHQKHLYMMICDKLHQMNLIDRSYHLDEFEFMRTHYRKALYKLLTLARATKTSRESSNGALCASKPSCLSLSLSSESLLEWSRYSNEFVEVEFIARGGFGRVYKARHKLDGSVYAVKKINLRYKNAAKFLHSLKEVKMLARLHHPNIVAYKAAWLEPFDNRSSSTNAPEALVVDEISNSSPNESHRFDKLSSNESSDIVFCKSKSTTSSDSAKKETFSKDCILSSDNSSSSPEKNFALCRYKSSLERVRAWNFTQECMQKDWATLFVQMQLCEDNMRQWLDKRNRSFSPVNLPQCVSVFTKILKGIEYIHDRGIVHHDIKPSNIFISKDLRQVQVGDFGLACCLLTHQTTVPLVPSEPPEHQGRIGTKLYAAPEQINGICDSKSDIYSMGIILLELITPFQTEMERSKVIQQLKKGKIPTELTASRPDLAKIISQTVTKSVSKRPSAGELLKVLSSKVRKESESSLIICEKDKIIRELQEEIAIKDAEILRLRQLLAASSIQSKPDSELSSL